MENLESLAAQAREAISQADDAAALESLEALATALKRDGNGHVVEVSFRGANLSSR